MSEQAQECSAFSKISLKERKTHSEVQLQCSLNNKMRLSDHNNSNCEDAHSTSFLKDTKGEKQLKSSDRFYQSKEFARRGNGFGGCEKVERIPSRIVSRSLVEGKSQLLSHTKNCLADDTAKSAKSFQADSKKKKKGSKNQSHKYLYKKALINTKFEWLSKYLQGASADHRAEISQTVHSRTAQITNFEPSSINASFSNLFTPKNTTSPTNAHTKKPKVPCCPEETQEATATNTNSCQDYICSCKVIETRANQLRSEYLNLEESNDQQNAFVPWNDKERKWKKEEHFRNLFHRNFSEDIENQIHSKTQVSPFAAQYCGNEMTPSILKEIGNDLHSTQLQRTNHKRSQVLILSRENNKVQPKPKNHTSEGKIFRKVSTQVTSSEKKSEADWLTEARNRKLLGYRRNLKVKQIKPKEHPSDACPSSLQSGLSKRDQFLALSSSTSKTVRGIKSAKKQFFEKAKLSKKGCLWSEKSRAMCNLEEEVEVQPWRLTNESEDEMDEIKVGKGANKKLR